MGFITGVVNAIVGRAPVGAGEQRAALVATHHPSANIDWAGFLGVQDRTAGLTPPTIEGSLAMPAVFACIRVLSETVASLPLITYRERADGGRERATDHPLYRILRRSPNAEQTPFEFEELLTSHVASYGNGYAEIELSNGGQVLGMWPLRPDRMRVRRRNGELQYLYTELNGKETLYPAWRIHHRRGLGGDGIVGYSPIGMAMLAITLGMATEEFGARFFANGARPGFVLTHPGELTDPAWERLDKRWNREGTLATAHKVKILEEGMKVEKIGIPPNEAQFIETRAHQNLDVARYFRMPPHKIGILDHATFSNIEHQAIEFYTDTIRPYLVRFEQALWRDLLSRDQQRTGIYFEYLADGVLRGDTPSRYQAFATARQWGWLSVNDIRKLENLEPIEGGDVYLQPLNMVQAGLTQRTNPAAWMQPIFDDVAKRMVRREAEDLRRQGTKILRSQPDQFASWAGEYYDELVSAASQMLAPATAAAATALGSPEGRVHTLVSGALWDASKRSLDRVRMIVREAPGHGMTPGDALGEYAETIESAGAPLIAGALADAFSQLVERRVVSHERD
jgi:HK97 family phage portal protein